MTSATNHRIGSTPPRVAPPLRLSLRPPGRRQRVLDGGWWPRSHDPGAELPDLITALNASRGMVHHVMLHADAWSPRPRRLSVDGRTVLIGWVRSLDPQVVSATYGNDDRLDLLVVPPRANMTRAAAALAAAADAGNTLRASDILRRLSIQLPPSAAADLLSESVWETDGGRVPDSADSAQPTLVRHYDN